MDLMTIIRENREKREKEERELNKNGKKEDSSLSKGITKLNERRNPDRVENDNTVSESKTSIMTSNELLNRMLKKG